MYITHQHDQLMMIICFVSCTFAITKLFLAVVISISANFKVNEFSFPIKIMNQQIMLHSETIPKVEMLNLTLGMVSEYVILQHSYLTLLLSLLVFDIIFQVRSDDVASMLSEYKQGLNSLKRQLKHHSLYPYSILPFFIILLYITITFTHTHTMPCCRMMVLVGTPFTHIVSTLIFPLT